MTPWGLHVSLQILRSVVSAFSEWVSALSAIFKSRATLQVANLALRHQLGLLQRSVKQP